MRLHRVWHELRAGSLELIAIGQAGRPVRFESATQGPADLAPIPLVTARSERDTAIPETVIRFIASLKATLGEQVSDVRTSERLTESAACLVAPQTGMDRQLERLLARSGRPGSAAEPVLEINPHPDLITAPSALREHDQALKKDAVHLLLDQTRIPHGELPSDAEAFAHLLAGWSGGPCPEGAEFAR